MSHDTSRENPAAQDRKLELKFPLHFWSGSVFLSLTKSLFERGGSQVYQGGHWLRPAGPGQAQANNNKNAMKGAIAHKHYGNSAPDSDPQGLSGASHPMKQFSHVGKVL